jgi:hypothetical protein
VDPDFGISGLDNLDRVFASLPNRVSAGVKLVGEAANYGLTWEFGRVDIKPGPKTMWSDSPAGYPAVMTITAPFGWIRINREQYISILREELGRANFANTGPGQWPEKLRTVLGYAAERCGNVMAETAPMDTGLLRSSIFPVPDGDPLLDENDGSFYDLGGDWI